MGPGATKRPSTWRSAKPTVYRYMGSEVALPLWYHKIRSIQRSPDDTSRTEDRFAHINVVQVRPGDIALREQLDACHRKCVYIDRVSDLECLVVALWEQQLWSMPT